MSDITLYIICCILCFLALIGVAFMIIANRCFDDKDPDQYWHDNYSVINCPHEDQFLWVSKASVTCETLVTECKDCGKVLKTEINC